MRNLKNGFALLVVSCSKISEEPEAVGRARPGSIWHCAQSVWLPLEGLGAVIFCLRKHPYSQYGGRKAGTWHGRQAGLRV